MLPFSRPFCYSKTRPPSCALGTSFYTVSEGSDLMMYVSDNYTSDSAPSCLRQCTLPLTSIRLHMIVYDCQQTGPPIWSTNPEVDFLSSKSPSQSESE